MKLKHLTQANEDYERTRSFLLQHEAYHSLMFGLLDTIIYSPHRFKAQPYVALVEQNDDVLAVALQTPPRKLLLSRVDEVQAIALIAQDLYSRQAPVPGVMATASAAKTFAQHWQELTGQSYHEGIQEGFYQLETVQPIPWVSGHLRQATLGDRELLIAWCHAFMEEVSEETVDWEVEEVVDRYLAEGSLHFWQDHIPLSLANFYSSTPNGVRINLVYTPPEHRRKGYATACVAALSQALLDRGYKYCFLSTDLNRPAPNHLYQAIGYQPLDDPMQHYWFDG
ncbi:MAG TPA: GNAT family N-acetyltransferase [Stenomitos sp.]